MGVTVLFGDRIEHWLVLANPHSEPLEYCIFSQGRGTATESPRSPPIPSRTVAYPCACYVHARITKRSGRNAEVEAGPVRTVDLAKLVVDDHFQKACLILAASHSTFFPFSSPFIAVMLAGGDAVGTSSLKISLDTPLWRNAPLPSYAQVFTFCSNTCDMLLQALSPPSPS